MKKTHFRLCMVTVLFSLLISACAPAPTSAPPLTAISTETLAPTATIMPTIVPTETLSPTSTPAPTAILAPTIQVDAPFIVYSHPELSGRLAVKTSNDEIYVMNADGTGLIRLPDDCDGINCTIGKLSWSPDGKQIAFLEKTKPAITYKLHVMNADGTEEIILPYNGRGELFWEPDGQRIRFAYYINEVQPRGIYAVKANGSKLAEPYNPYNIPDLSKGKLGSMVWSPDGTKFAITNPDGSVSVMNIDGSWIATLDGGYIIHWSPDGQKIGALERVLDSRENIIQERLVIQNFDGTEQSLVFVRGGQVFPILDFTWSPDGKKIAFTDGLEIDVIDLDGTDKITLVNACSGDCYAIHFISWIR